MPAAGRLNSILLPGFKPGPYTASKETVVNAAAAPSIGTSLIPFEEATHRESLRSQWRSLIFASKNHRALQASLEWSAHKARLGSAIDLVTVHGEDATLMGIAPLQVNQYALVFEISNRVLCRRTLSARVLMGGQPLLPDEPGAYDEWLRVVTH